MSTPDPHDEPGLDPYLTHDFLVGLFTDQPKLSPDLLTDPFGIPLPAYERIHLSANDLTDLIPAKYHADTVVTLYQDDTPVMAIITEVQMHYKPQKLLTWMVYVAVLQRRLGCPVRLLVVCPSAALAARYAQPYTLGDLTLTPNVMPLDRVPVVNNAQRARDNPQLAVMSALAHGDHPDYEQIFGALRAGLETVDETNAKLYLDVILSKLSRELRLYLEAQLLTRTREYQSDFARRYYGEGKAEGRAEGLLSVLAANKIEVDDDTRARITGCTDLDQLDTWTRRAVSATSLHDVFDETRAR